MQKWAALDRRKGESRSSWLRRNHEGHIYEWRQEKMRNGTWLPKSEYERLTGRLGRI